MDNLITMWCITCIQNIWKISSETNQDLVKTVEQFGQLFAQTLNEDIPEVINPKSNIGMYAILLLFF